MSKFIRAKKFIDDIAEKTDKEIHDFLKKITTDSDLKEISGIYKNSFINQSITRFGKNKRYSDKERSSIIRTLGVYADNLHRAGKV